MRSLHFLFGDQLMKDHPFLVDFDPEQHRLAMAEVVDAASIPKAHKKKIVLFFSAMRHFKQACFQQEIDIQYIQLNKNDRCMSFSEALDRFWNDEAFKTLRVMQPGDVAVENEFRAWCCKRGVTLEIVPDPHFYTTPEDFSSFSKGRKSIRMEFFYRNLRKKYKILMDEEGQPIGGQWNFDHDNRKSFGKQGPPEIPSLKGFEPDKITLQVMEEVDVHFPHHPGTVEGFDYPVTPQQAEIALEDFINSRLVNYGQYQDAMATGHTFLFHGRLSSSLNLHLLNPRVCVQKAEAAMVAGAPLNAVEGFIRQILGWREYVRGIYFQMMPSYEQLNALDAEENVPASLWGKGSTMKCIDESMHHVMEHAYTHHIERLMVLGLYAMLLGVHPQKLHIWHMALFADAIDWVSMPNVMGMSQYADNGYLASKPYCASGAYINRMSDYCRQCQYDPSHALGPKACPMTTLYWRFLAKHKERFANNPRMTMQLKNLDRKSVTELDAIMTLGDQWVLKERQNS